MKSKNPYKLTSARRFGNVWIHQEKLNDFKLEAYIDDKKILSRKAGWDLIDLLTKRYNSKKQHSPQSLETFVKLIDLSGLPINAHLLKYSAGCDLSAAAAKKTGGAIQYYKGLMNWSNDCI